MGQGAEFGAEAKRLRGGEGEAELRLQHAAGFCGVLGARREAGGEGLALLLL